MSSPFMEAPRETLERLFAEGMAAAQAGRLPEAADKLDQIVALEPAIPDVYWNLGTWRAQMQQHDLALVAWDAYRALVPDDWRARPKIIQSCQALGDTARRDRERDALLALRRSGADPALAAEPQYCIEQFSVGELAVFAYEIFAPQGELRVFYKFIVGRPDGPVEAHYSLGSYDFTTLPARERGEIGPEERIYHLDRYDPVGHTTFGFYLALPSYDEVRAGVVAALTGTTGPVSSSTVSPDRREANIYLHRPATSTGGPGEGGPQASPGGRLASWTRRILGRDARPN